MPHYQYANQNRQRRNWILPVGSVEQHGEHLPVTTDCLIAEILAEDLARAADAVLLPVVPVTCSHEHAAFGGSASVSAPIAFGYIEAIIADARRQACRGLIIVNGHGGNYFLSNLVQEHSRPDQPILLAPQKHHFERAFQDAGLETDMQADMHGGEFETSILLARRPEAVRQNLIADAGEAKRPLLLTLGMQPYTPTGIIGAPSRATAAKGEKLVKSLVTNIMAEFVAVVGGGSASTHDGVQHRL